MFYTTVIFSHICPIHAHNPGCLTFVCWLFVCCLFVGCLFIVCLLFVVCCLGVSCFVVAGICLQYLGMLYEIAVEFEECLSSYVVT